MSGHASGSSVVGATVSTTAIAGVATALRLYTRVSIVDKAGADDIFIAAAAVLSVVLTVTMCKQVEYGMGRHQSSLTMEEATQSLLWFYVSIPVYYSGLCFAKVSILLQYLRVFPHDKFRKAAFILMAVICAYSVGTILASLFACSPVSFFWKKTKNVDGSCVDLQAIWFTNASINIITDICTAVLPLPVLHSLLMPKRQKYALMAVFALGGFTCIISILRLQSLWAVANTKDISWKNPLAAIWSSSELNVGIICSCLPTLKGCVKKVFPGIFTSSSGNRSGGTYPSANHHYGGGGAGAGANPKSWTTYNNNASFHQIVSPEKGRVQTLAYGDDQHHPEDEEDDATALRDFSSSAGRRHNNKKGGDIRVHTAVEQSVDDSHSSDSIRLAQPPRPYHAV